MNQKNKKTLKAYIKMGTVITFGGIEIQKQIFYQRKEPISIKSVDIDKLVVSDKVPFGKKDLNILLAIKMLKILDLFCLVYFSLKYVRIEMTFMKLNICIFDKRWWIIQKV